MSMILVDHSETIHPLFFRSYIFFSLLGVDEQLARHYAHLFIRDPLTLFREHIYEDDEHNSNHFEVSSK